MNKKQFAKTVSDIRKTLGTKEFPKAMMTGQQEANHTCTVNCNDRWNRHLFNSSELASAVLRDCRFSDMLHDNNAVAVIEDNPDGFKQIRVRW